MIIANPVYDTVFKYLMYEHSIAKRFLSVILNVDIINLKFSKIGLSKKVSDEIESRENGRKLMEKLDLERWAERTRLEDKLEEEKLKRQKAEKEKQKVEKEKQKAEKEKINMILEMNNNNMKVGIIANYTKISINKIKQIIKNGGIND